MFCCKYNFDLVQTEDAPTGLLIFSSQKSHQWQFLIMWCSCEGMHTALEYPSFAREAWGEW